MVSHIKVLWILMFLVGTCSADLRYVCEVCTCDNVDQPKTVDCNGKQLITLTNLFFNETIEQLILTNNSLELKSDEDLQIVNNITSLKYLDLSKNPLVVIPKLMLNYLEYLNFEETELKSARFPTSFENSTKLQIVLLSKNNIKQIDADDLKCLTALTKLYLDADALVSIDRNTFITQKNTLTSLSVISNSLQSTEFLSHVNNLLSIDLDENHLKRFPKEIVNASQIKHVSLRNNLVEAMDESSPLFYWMKTNRSDIEVYLSSNPFDCCQSRWLIHYLSGPANLVKDAMHLRCNSPKLYAGRRLIDLRADLMNCANEPFHPSNPTWSKSTITLLTVFCIVIVLLVLIGINLYRGSVFPFRTRQQGYESIAGDDVPGAL